MSVNDYEKQQYAVAGETPSDHAVGDVTDTKGNAINEAAGVYGSVQKAEDYGYVQRGVKSRHIQFIALGGTIGTDTEEQTGTDGTSECDELDVARLEASLNVAIVLGFLN